MVQNIRLLFHEDWDFRKILNLKKNYSKLYLTFHLSEIILQGTIPKLSIIDFDETW